MNDRRRLVEVAFPLKQTSIDSVHEKNVRHGHISTLHIWPARRPLAACRAALITTLLPDPGNDAERKRVLERMAGKVVSTTKKKKLGGRVEETHSEETAGGVLHWGLEAGPDLQWFRDEIRKAYGGRAPRVFDPFAGGGAIPLEAMRLGCEVTAGDINPVAWMILRCTLEYPQRIAGHRRPLPEFVRRDRGFMESFFKSQGLKSAAVRTQLERLGFGGKGDQAFGDFFRDEGLLDAGLAWHVRAWGTWVLARARQDLERFYLTVDGKPTVGYLWARTVACKGCRALLPLLKTRWLCKKDSKRVLLTMRPNDQKSGVVFGVQNDVALQGGNAAQRREHDKRLGAGTMSRSGATCPCCQTTMTMSDLRLEGSSGRLGAVMTAVVVDGAKGKEYRLPHPLETNAVSDAEKEIDRIFSAIPFGVPDEPTPKGGSGASRAFSVDGYGLDRWSKLFTPRQLCALGSFVSAVRSSRDGAAALGYPAEWVEAIVASVALMVDRLANQSSTLARWNQGGENIEGTFARFALPMLWDYAEVNPLGDTSGGFPSAVEWVSLALDHFTAAVSAAPPPRVILGSAAQEAPGKFDLVLTDPPYYDAIPYSDLMDFFYVWLRRGLSGLSPQIDEAFREPLGPKWDESKNDGELIDDSSRFAGDASRSRATYEDGMARSFLQAQRSLTDDGRLVIVFAHKQPDAWETLVSAIIRAGFVVDGSWPIQTERTARTRSLSSAALSSSVWLVCKKRPESARPGWDNRVLDEMRERIRGRLREFWDAGIRGPDVVWAATGPALEAYSQHPVVKKADEPGQVMSVSEFLRHVRRMVVDFVVGRVLSHDGEEQPVSGLDDITTYYLLHRHDFGMADAPIGPCILYAVSCGLSDGDLVGTHDLLARKGQVASAEGDDEESEEEEASAGGGSMVRLKPWTQRLRKTLGYEGPGGRVPPLVDQIHCLMHLWKAGDVNAVNAYLDDRELRYSPLFPHLLQALVELSEKEERAILESLANHVRSLGTRIPSTRELPLS